MANELLVAAVAFGVALLFVLVLALPLWECFYVRRIYGERPRRDASGQPGVGAGYRN